MVDTPLIDSTARRARVPPQERTDQAPQAKIIALPEALENTRRAQKLRGEIVQKEPNGTLHIRTDKGEIILKPLQKIAVEQGDIVYVTIQKGQPPQTAQIQTPPAPAVPKDRQTTDTASYITQSIAVHLPPIITAQALINGAPVTVQLIPPAQIQTIIAPYVENLNVNMDVPPPIPVLQALPFDNAAGILLIEDALEIRAPILNADTVTLPKLVTEIPLRTVIAQSISNPPKAPITLAINTPDVPALSIFAEIIIRDIAPPLPRIHPAETPLLSQERAGETRGVIVGFTQDRHFLILRITAPESHTDQHYALQIPIEELPLGTRISFEVTQSQQNITTPLPSLNAPALLSPNIWPVMQELQEALIQANPVAAHAFSSIIPQASAPHQLAPAALFFLAALRAGDFQSWLGERAIQSLKQAGKSALLNRLGREIATLSRQHSEPTPQEWRALTLPLAWQNEIHKITMHYRKESEDGTDNAQKKTTKTRFIMDLNLSVMGKIQLDGLFIGDPNGKARVDLILRTEENFSAPVKMAMRERYKDALDDTNFTGALSFQGQKENWVHIAPSALAAFSDDV